MAFCNRRENVTYNATHQRVAQKSLQVILHYKVQSVCVSVYVSMFVRNRLPTHAYYSDGAFAGDAVGLGLGQRLNSIFKKLILVYFWGKIAPDEKILFESQAGAL